MTLKQWGMEFGIKLLLGVSCLLFGGCGRDRATGWQEPAPRASVITIGVAPGACSDIPVCERECDAGSADRCRRLAETYSSGQGVDKDEERATALFEHACEMKDPSACVSAGRMYEFSHGVAKDDVKAAHLYEMACDFQWAPGCYNLAIMAERGTGVPQDRARASALFRIACSAGAKPSCERASALERTASTSPEGGAP